MFKRTAPKISRGIGQEADIGEVAKHGRNISSTAYQISSGCLSQSPIGQNLQDVANKLENGATFVSGNEERAHKALSTISRKLSA